jgi:type II pantothenate kinase
LDSHKTVIKATGGGAHLFYDKLRLELGVDVQKEDEMLCLITGLNFLVQEIPYEVYTFSETNPMRFVKPPTAQVFPYMLVNIGSGVSILKVTGESEYERISGTSLGGGTLWGLLSLLTSADTFDEMLYQTKNGDNSKVDLLVGDIYGTDYNRIGLKATTIASSMGKVFRDKPIRKDFGENDIARSLLYMVSNNIGQIAYLNAKLHNLDRIYFGGYFIRGHPVTMNTLSYAINFWSKGQMQAMFLRHEGYLGAIGAFLRHPRTFRHRGSFTENFTTVTRIHDNSLHSLGVLDQMPMTFAPFPKLRGVDDGTYQPDTLLLEQNTQAQHYWINVLEKNVGNVVDMLISQHEENPTSSGIEDGERVREQAKRFGIVYRAHLTVLKEKPNEYGSLTVRGLLDLREQCLHKVGFRDVFHNIKQKETDGALERLPTLLKSLDALETGSKQHVTTLVHNAWAGNMFDWGSNHVMAMLRKGELDFSNALEKIGQPPKFVQLDEFSARIQQGPPYQKVVLFVDNSGADIVLGMIPLARGFLKFGAKTVILAANSFPAVNDVTCEELVDIVNRVATVDPLVRDALDKGRLLVRATGSGSPCLDLSRLDDQLVSDCADVDLVVLEGMGRCIHTNYYATFSCASLKVAVIKNAVIADAIGAQMYDAVCLFSQH